MTAYALQPIVSSGLRPYGHEVLLRASGYPSPVDFLTRLCNRPRFESEYLHQALTQTAGRCGTLFFNVGPQSLRAVVDTLPAQRGDIVLELTDGDYDAGLLREARDRGAGLALDDVGGELHRLTHMASWPLTHVKFDRTLLDAGARGEVLLAHCIAACHDLGILALVEAVETTAEVVRALDLGTDLLQGYVLGRPRTYGRVEGMHPIHGMAVPEEGLGVH